MNHAPRRSMLARATAPAAILLATTALGVVGPPQGSDATSPFYDGIAREGLDARRDALDAMERRPFDFSLFSSLSSWSEDGPPTSADTSGKVVLVFTWAGWYPSSMRVFPMVESLHQKHGDDLVIVGVHAPRRGEGCAQIASKRGATFRVAHDKDGTLRTALRVDQDPDFYVIDRAGQLRCADVQTGAVVQAVEMLIAEDRSQAASLNERLADQAARAEAQFHQTASINQDVDLRKLPEIPFIAPPSGAYAHDRFGRELDWPTFPLGENQRQQDDADPTFPIVIPQTIEFQGDIPKTAGRAIVVYFWHPDYLGSHETVMPGMDRLALQRGRDLVIIGLMTPLEQSNRGGAQNTQLNDPERLRKVLAGMLRARKHEHSIAFDALGTVIESVRSSTNQRNSSRGVQRLAVVVSSEGVVRWWGSPLSEGFRLAVDKVLRVDPGVAARRAAEAEYIKANFGK